MGATESTVDKEQVKISIQSEYAPLQCVLVHAPGSEVDRLTPYNRSALLFEDIPYLPAMVDEHKEFVELLQSQGVRTLILGELLEDILNDRQTRTRLMHMCCDACMQPSLANMLLDNYAPSELKEILIRGITCNELEERTGKRLGISDEAEDPFLIEPCPNCYFTRDPAVAIGNSIVSCKMHYTARIRESIIIREIFRNHPSFAGAPFIFGNTPEEDRPFTIEGGDIIVLSEKAVAVGRSQRTRSESIGLLAKKLFRAGLAERVYEIEIPVERIYMHLDTVFTVIDEGLVVAFPDVMSQVTEIRRYEPILISNRIMAIPIDENRTFNGILEDEFGSLTVVHTGNNDRRYAAREQQADGTNVFAIAPHTVVTYDRNTETNKALRAAGVEVLEIKGSELVRGLGGPRCMTMPLWRN